VTPGSDAEQTPDDPVVEALLVIAGELRAIRQELERLDSDGDEGADEDADEDVDEYECRGCGAVLAGASAARQHAMDEHGAPAADWTTLYQ
jgi:hypothetical protein